MNLKLHVWRQSGPNDAGAMKEYVANGHKLQKF